MDHGAQGLCDMYCKISNRASQGLIVIHKIIIGKVGYHALKTSELFEKSSSGRKRGGVKLGGVVLEILLYM